MKRSADRSRTDGVYVDTSGEKPESLDELRETKGKRYFKALFALPEKQQFAEMENWDEADHAAAIEYLSVDGFDDEESDDDLGIEVREEPPPVFDEEDHADD